MSRRGGSNASNRSYMQARFNQLGPQNRAPRTKMPSSSRTLTGSAAGTPPPPPPAPSAVDGAAAMRRQSTHDLFFEDDDSIQAVLSQRGLGSSSARRPRDEADLGHMPNGVKRAREDRDRHDVDPPEHRQERAPMRTKRAAIPSSSARFSGVFSGAVRPTPSNFLASSSRAPAASSAGSSSASVGGDVMDVDDSSSDDDEQPGPSARNPRVQNSTSAARPDQDPIVISSDEESPATDLRNPPDSPTMEIDHNWDIFEDIAPPPSDSSSDDSEPEILTPEQIERVRATFARRAGLRNVPDSVYTWRAAPARPKLEPKLEDVDAYSHVEVPTGAALLPPLDESKLVYMTDRARLQESRAFRTSAVQIPLDVAWKRFKTEHNLEFIADGRKAFDRFLDEYSLAVRTAGEKALISLLMYLAAEKHLKAKDLPEIIVDWRRREAPRRAPSPEA